MFARIILLLAAISLVACEGTLDADADLSSSSALSGEPDAAPMKSKRRPPAQPTEEPDDTIYTPDPEPTVEATPQADPAPADPSTPGLIVEFRIAAGTDQGKWNTMEDAPLLYVGQILRIVNNDTRAHQLHVPGDGPFRHGQPIPPGAQVEYLVESPWALEPQARMYDHQFGNTAGFWMQAVE